MVRVSVIIPTYNRPEHLEGAITSALDQTIDDIEVVVVDDGSDTSYAESTVAEFPDTVRCVHHDENKGLSAARNTGIERARGEFVAFLDDDDRWHPTKTERQLDALEDYPEAGMAICLLTAISPDGEPVRCEGGKPHGDLSDEILVRNVIGTPSRVLVRASCLDAVGGFDESIATVQDWDLFIRICQDYEVACVDDHLCYRTVHTSMSSDPEMAVEDNRRVIDKHESLVRSRDRYEEMLAAYYANVGRTYLEDDQPDAARSYLLRSLRESFRLWHAGLLLLTLFGTRGSRAVIGLKRAVERWLYCDGARPPTS